MTEEINENPELSGPFVRFRDIIPGERMASLRVALVGAGGIGAPCALALAKMGVHHLEVWDPDVVGPENIGPQMYSQKHIGQFKVNTLKNFLRSQAGWCKVTAHTELYRANTEHDCHVVVVGVDSLRARKDIWASINHDLCGLVVDARMGAEVLNVFSVVPKEDGEWYATTLEGVPVEAKCTAKSTFHCGLIAGSLAAREVKAWVVEERTMVEYMVDLRHMGLLGMNQEQRQKVFAESGSEEAA